MRRCGNGHEVSDDGFEFCPRCGERLHDVPTSAPDEVQPEPDEPVDAHTVAWGDGGASVEGLPVETPPVSDGRRRWPLSVGWSIVVALITGFTGLLVLLAIYLWRGNNRGGAVVAAAAFALIAVIVVAAVATGGSSSSGSADATGSKAAKTSTSRRAAAPAKACSSYTGVKPQSCISKTGFACSGYAGSARPDDCFTAAQLHARVVVRHAAVRAAAKARLAAAARAKARAAALAAANAWHQGYVQQDDNVYWKWVKSGSCQDFATNGCWHVAVITQYGCPNYVGVNANEYQNGAVVNSLLDNQSYGIPAETERIFELDADADNVIANDVHIDCS